MVEFCLVWLSPGCFPGKGHLIYKGPQRYPGNAFAHFQAMTMRNLSQPGQVIGVVHHYAITIFLEEE